MVIKKGSKMTTTTKRAYLKTKGITVGARGRFSGAAKVAIQEAEKSGVTFITEAAARKQAKN